MSILEGKVAIITGGARGVGRSTALAYAREGARVVVNSRTRSEIERTVQDILDAGGEAIGVEVDVSRPEDVSRLVKEAVSRWGTVDILVNNAGVVGPAGPVGWDDINQWRYALEVNLFGCYLTLHEVIPIMVKQGRGKVINVSSPSSMSHGHTSGASLTIYGVSKAGLIRLTMAVAAQNAKYGIDVNLLDVVGQTELTRDIGSRKDEDPIAAEWFRRRAETGLVLHTDENVPMVLFLASSESDGLTGRYFKWSMNLDDIRANKEKIIASPTALRAALDIPEYIRQIDIANWYWSESAKVMAQIQAEFAEQEARHER